jgi:hypothetical protein
MAIFPTLSRVLNVKYSDADDKPILNMQFDGNYEQTRPRATRSRRIFNIGYVGLTDSDKTTLTNFLLDNTGLSFNFTNPSDSTLYVVRLNQDLSEIEWKFIPPSYWQVNLTLKEV